jgi:hypothetical protein
MIAVEAGNIAAIPFEFPSRELAEILAFVTEKMRVIRSTASRSACIQRVPETLFSEMCQRLMDPTVELKATLKWLQRQMKCPPSLSAIAKFSDTLRAEYLRVLADRYLPGRRS